MRCSPKERGRCGKIRGDYYGAPKYVASASEAKKLFEEYFAGENITVSDITERPRHFAADIKDKNGKIIDRVIIIKRSGRIRSIF